MLYPAIPANKGLLALLASLLLSISFAHANTDDFSLKFAVIPDTQGADDNWGKNRVTLPNGTKTHLGIDWNKDGYYDGEGFLIDISSNGASYWHPKLVLNENQNPTLVENPKDFPIGYRHLPLPLVEPIVAKIIEEQVDMVLAVGDLTDLRSEHEYQQWMEKVAKPLLTNHINVYPVRGNHEVVDGNDWQQWFDAAPHVGKPTSVNNVDNGIDAYQANDTFDQGYKLYQAYPGSLIQDKIAKGLVIGYPGIEDLVYYFVEGDTLFIGLDYYFSSLINNSYRGSWTLLKPWLQDVLEKHKHSVKHRVVFAHEPLAPKKRPLTGSQGINTTNAPTENLFGLDIGQIGYMHMQEAIAPNLTQDILSLFAEHQVMYLSGHDHQYSRSLIRANSNAPVKNMFTQIITGNASWKAYENRFGFSPEYEVGLAQHNFVDEHHRTSSLSFVIVEMSSREIRITNWYHPISFSPNDMTQGLHWESHNQQWLKPTLDKASNKVNWQRLDANWQKGDVYHYAIDADKRIVKPRQNYWFTSEAPKKSGYLGSSAAIYDGYNLTFNTHQIQTPSGDTHHKKRVPLNELLTFSWFNDNDSITVSDIVMISGISGQTGSSFDAQGLPLTASPSTFFFDNKGKQVANPETITSEQAQQGYADTVTLSLSVPNAQLTNAYLARYDDNNRQWHVVTNKACFVATAYSEDFSVVYGKERRGRMPKDKNGKVLPEHCHMKLWGYNHNNQTLWAMINREGKYAVIQSEADKEKH